MGALPDTVCVIRDPQLRRRLRRSLEGTGPIQFCDSVDGAKPFRPRLLFLDKESRGDAELPSYLRYLGESSKIVLLEESVGDKEVLQAMQAKESFDNALDADIEEHDLLITSSKLLSGDIFGLSKYLSWGCEIRRQSVTDYDDKLEAITAVGNMAKERGARRHAFAAIQTVVDELLMNALYDAPAAAEQGYSENLDFQTNPALGAPTGQPASLSFACDGRYFGVSVVDSYGLLRKKAILDNFINARERGGKPREGASGAGLGTYFVLSSVSKYIVNIDEGQQTEVICLFDMRKSGRNRETCTRSLQIFTV